MLLAWRSNLGPGDPTAAATGLYRPQSHGCAVLFAANQHIAQDSVPCLCATPRRSPMLLDIATHSHHPHARAGHTMIPERRMLVSQASSLSKQGPSQRGSRQDDRVWGSALSSQQDGLPSPSTPEPAKHAALACRLIGQPACVQKQPGAGNKPPRRHF